MKQSAVEWFEKELQNLRIETPFYTYEKAKEMEKQQIIDAWDRGQYIGSSFPNNQIEVEFEKNAEQYYNEIFKNK